MSSPRPSRHRGRLRDWITTAIVPQTFEYLCGRAPAPRLYPASWTRVCRRRLPLYRSNLRLLSNCLPQYLSLPCWWHIISPTFGSRSILTSLTWTTRRSLWTTCLLNCVYAPLPGEPTSGTPARLHQLPVASEMLELERGTQRRTTRPLSLHPRCHPLPGQCLEPRLV